jgi:hypothetical protein
MITQRPVIGSLRKSGKLVSPFRYVAESRISNSTQPESIHVEAFHRPQDASFEGLHFFRRKPEKTWSTFGLGVW